MVTWTKDDLKAHEMKTAKQHNMPVVGSGDVSFPIEVKTYDFTPRANTDEARLNKLEKAFLTHLRCLKYENIHIQAITLKLADDVRYTPDFSYRDFNGRMVMAEVKGFMRDDARVKLRVAARAFPEFIFVLCTKSKSIGWVIEEVKQ